MHTHTHIRAHAHTRAHIRTCTHMHKTLLPACACSNTFTTLPHIHPPCHSLLGLSHSPPSCMLILHATAFACLRLCAHARTSSVSSRTVSPAAPAALPELMRRSFSTREANDCGRTQVQAHVHCTHILQAGRRVHLVVFLMPALAGMPTILASASRARAH